MLGADDSALDNKDIQTGFDSLLVILLYPLRRERGSRNDTGAFNSTDSFGDEFRLDRFSIDFLKTAGRFFFRK